MQSNLPELPEGKLPCVNPLIHRYARWIRVEWSKLYDKNVTIINKKQLNPIMKKGSRCINEVHLNTEFIAKPCKDIKKDI